MKLQDGAWYKSAGGTVHQVSEEARGFRNTGGDRVLWDSFGRVCSTMSAKHNLVERVNPPTPYVPTKKWKWEKHVTISATTDGQYQASIAAVMTTDNYWDENGPDELDPEWQPILETEIET